MTINAIVFLNSETEIFKLTLDTGMRVRYLNFEPIITASVNFQPDPDECSVPSGFLPDSKLFFFSYPQMTQKLADQYLNSKFTAYSAPLRENLLYSSSCVPAEGDAGALSIHVKKEY